MHEYVCCACQCCVYAVCVRVTFSFRLIINLFLCTFINPPLSCFIGLRLPFSLVGLVRKQPLSPHVLVLLLCSTVIYIYIYLFVWLLPVLSGHFCGQNCASGAWNKTHTEAIYLVHVVRDVWWYMNVWITRTLRTRPMANSRIVPAY